jgi:hypothetical protein
LIFFMARRKAGLFSSSSDHPLSALDACGLGRRHQHRDVPLAEIIVCKIEDDRLLKVLFFVAESMGQPRQPLAVNSLCWIVAFDLRVPLSGNLRSQASKFAAWPILHYPTTLSGSKSRFREVLYGKMQP